MPMKAYLSLVKFAHTVFALPFALLSFFIALNATGSEFSFQKLLLVLGAMVFARSAAMGFNRYIDRKYDAINPRTATREIPSGVISPSSALTFVALMCIAFIIVCYFINPLCFYLSPVALLVVLGYSFTKRFTWLCHFVLGMGLGLAPVGAYAAVTGEIHILPVLYGFMVMLWVSGFDIIYALQDEDFDKSHQLHSIPGRFGKAGAKQIARGIHLLCVVLLIFITYYQSQIIPGLAILHWLGAAGFAFLVFWQHRLISLYDLKKINQAFFQTNGIASLIFGATVILDLLV